MRSSTSLSRVLLSMAVCLAAARPAISAPEGAAAAAPANAAGTPPAATTGKIFGVLGKPPRGPGRGPGQGPGTPVYMRGLIPPFVALANQEKLGLRPEQVEAIKKIGQEAKPKREAAQAKADQLAGGLAKLVGSDHVDIAAALEKFDQAAAAESAARRAVFEMMLRVRNQLDATQIQKLRGVPRPKGPGGPIAGARPAPPAGAAAKAGSAAAPTAAPAAPGPSAAPLH